MKQAPEPFEIADVALKQLNHTIVREFAEAKNRMRLAGFDELNVIGECKALYSELDKANRKKYRELFVLRYLEVFAWLIATAETKTAKPSEDTVDQLAELYITGLLSEPNEVTHYTYDTEVLRKRDKAAEAVNAVSGKGNKQEEMERHKRYWAAQTGYYADIVCEGANREALNAAGVKRVVWHTEEDNKVCSLCNALDGKVFDIDKIPAAPHPHCRCYVTAENGEKSVENSANSDIMESEERGMDDVLHLEEEIIGRSLGAKLRDQYVLDFQTGEYYRLAEGSKLQNVEVFAGKGVRTEYRNAERYAMKYGGSISDWQHVKGIGTVETEDGDRSAELHWSQCDGIGKVDFFIKRWLE